MLNSRSEFSNFHFNKLSLNILILYYVGYKILYVLVYCCQEHKSFKAITGHIKIDNKWYTFDSA